MKIWSKIQDYYKENLFSTRKKIKNIKMKYFVERSKRAFALSKFLELEPWPALCVAQPALFVINIVSVAHHVAVLQEFNSKKRLQNCFSLAGSRKFT